MTSSAVPAADPGHQQDAKAWLWTSRRPGGALLLALLFLFVIDAVVLGTVYVAMLERRLADNVAAALRLRLAAESAAASAASPWTAQLDSLFQPRDEAGVRSPLVQTNAAGDLDVRAFLEALAGGLLLVHATARETPPGSGIAAAAALWLPPALPPGADPAPAAFAAAAVHIAEAGTIATTSDSCGAGPAIHSAAPPTGPGAVTGDTIIGLELSLAPFLPRMLGWAAAAPSLHLTAVTGDHTLDSSGSGVVLVDGSLTLAAGTHFHGLLIARDEIAIQPTASLVGAAHAGAAGTVAGQVTLDACEVRRLVQLLAMDRAILLPTRPSVPGFP